MPNKIDVDATAGEKLLRLFRKLMIDGRKHFQSDLADNRLAKRINSNFCGKCDVLLK